MTLDEMVTAHFVSWWMGFSLMFVVLGALWSFIEGPASRVRAPWFSISLRAVLFVAVGVGALGTAMLRFPGDDGVWTALSLWGGIVLGLVVAVCLLGDPRKWGKNEPS